MVAQAGRGWKLAPCLVAMVDEANRIAPDRNRKADGSIGDTAHSARKSDHNPANGWVTALDLTHAPASGFDAHARARQVIARQDERIKYVISNGMIAKSYASRGRAPWIWQPYTGPNPHRHHAHFSIHNTPTARDDVRPWWPHSQQGDELTMAQIDDIMAALDDIRDEVRVMHGEQTRQHARVVELFGEAKTKAIALRDSLAKLIRGIHEA